MHQVHIYLHVLVSAFFKGLKLNPASYSQFIRYLQSNYFLNIKKWNLNLGLPAFLAKSPATGLLGNLS